MILAIAGIAVIIFGCVFALLGQSHSSQSASCLNSYRVNCPVNSSVLNSNVHQKISKVNLLNVLYNGTDSFYIGSDGGVYNDSFLAKIIYQKYYNRSRFLIDQKLVKLDNAPQNGSRVLDSKILFNGTTTNYCIKNLTSQYNCTVSFEAFPPEAYGLSSIIFINFNSIRNMSKQIILKSVATKEYRGLSCTLMQGNGNIKRTNSTSQYILHIHH